MLITAQECIDLAFTNKNVNLALLKNNFIEIAQEDHIRPVLGIKFYDELITQSPFTADNQKVIDLLKPALAFYVKYEALPDLIIQLGNKGARIPTDEFSIAVSNEQRSEFLRKIKSHGDSLANKMIRFIEDNRNKYPLYIRTVTVKSNFGGIIFDEEIFVSKEDER